MQSSRKEMELDMILMTNQISIQRNIRSIMSSVTGFDVDFCLVGYVAVLILSVTLRKSRKLTKMCVNQLMISRSSSSAITTRVKTGICGACEVQFSVFEWDDVLHNV